MHGCFILHVRGTQPKSVPLACDWWEVGLMRTARSSQRLAELNERYSIRFSKHFFHRYLDRLVGAKSVQCPVRHWNFQAFTFQRLQWKTNQRLIQKKTGASDSFPPVGSFHSRPKWKSRRSAMLRHSTALSCDANDQLFISQVCAKIKVIYFR